MKLLASVLSIAAADYACCPYDEYGVPDPNCSGVLTEKSPFAANNVQLVAAESHACKAWEANAGAALEDHKADGTVVHDWGSCGYQRHFPWYNKNPAASTDDLVKLGLYTTGLVPRYEVLGVAGADAGTGYSMHSLLSGSFSGKTAGNKPIVGDVHLGGVCKLFVPVQKDFIRQVSIAGVHINNARIAGGAIRVNSAEMNARVVGGFVDGVDAANGNPATAWTGLFHSGTAYCFSVVNVAEFMTNRANNIANANVAGTDTRTAAEKIMYADDQGQHYTSAGVATDANFGLVWPGHDGTTDPTAGTAGVKNSGQHKVNMGSNFDVVVHFDSAWCAAHWELVDMQKTNDHGNGQTTGASPANLQGASPGTGAVEAMMDAWDKRLPANVGSCGLCKDKSGVSRGPSLTPVISDCASNTWTDNVPGASTVLDTADTLDYHGVTSACGNLNSYLPASGYRWPNAGAWAAFYSFVTCARSDYMIYGVATRTQRQVTLPGVTESVIGTPNPAEGASPATAANTTGNRNNDNRMVVVGGWHQDYRHGTGACVRFNLRQVGENIRYCADGDEEEFNEKDANTLYKNPTGDTNPWSQDASNRCTWNWNYNQLTGFDAESWFDSIDPLHMQVWATEEFIDEPAPGTTNTGGYKAAVAAGTLTADVVINVMIQERRYARNGVMPGAFVPPTSLDMDGDYATGALDTAFVATAAPGAGYAPFDNVGGGQPGVVTLACKNTGKYNGGNVNNAAARMRDHFPDCFFGDEIHGQWTWNTQNVLQDLDAASNTAVWKFWAMLQ